MTQREKLLGALVVAILVGLGARSVHTRLDETYRNYANRETSLRDTLFEEELKVSAGLKATGLLASWRERSLPADSTQANLLYNNWLLEQMDQSGLSTIEAPTMNTQVRRPDGTILEYTIVSEGSLDELTEFLYRFYRANHLHKISRISFEPDESGQTFTVTMRFEAWALEDSFNSDALATEPSSRLAYDSLDEYRDSIVERNIFVEYEPPPKQEDRVVEKFDHAEHTRATAVVESNGRPQVWIYVLSTGDKYWLSEGESFKVGEMECKIVKIDTRSIIFETEGKQYSVKLGSYFRDGRPLDSDQAISG